ncbi:MAG: hypothetical protein Q8928_12385 [Bacteroidota bacterium]|nr:hypothetical protein [Bacteroidota bacterium]
MDNLEIINRYNEIVFGLQEKLEIQSFLDFTKKDSLSSKYDETVNVKRLINPNLDFKKKFNDLRYCSLELIYSICNVHLYFPYINNPIEDSFIHAGKIVYPYYENVATLRFYTYFHSALEKLYNYWDRIGDIIGMFFTEKINDSNINFSNSLKLIPIDYQGTENYKWFADFKENDYNVFNEKRRNIVHHTLLSTDAVDKSLKNVTNQISVRELIRERQLVLDFLCDQQRKTNIGFEKMINLMNKK